MVVFGGLRRTKHRLWTLWRAFLRFPSRSRLSAKIPSVLVSSAAEQIRNSRGWKYLHSGSFLPLKNIWAFADLFAPDGTWVSGRLNKHTAEARLSARSGCLQSFPLRTAPCSFTITRSASTAFCPRVVSIESFLCFLFFSSSYSPFPPGIDLLHCFIHILHGLVLRLLSIPHLLLRDFVCLFVAAFQNRVKPSGLDVVNMNPSCSGWGCFPGRCGSCLSGWQLSAAQERGQMDVQLFLSL